MALNLPTLRKKADIVPTPKPKPPRNQVAAASRIRFDGTGWKTFKFNNNLWQLEAWRHYDRCGELHAVSNAIANLVSRVDIAIWKVENGKPVAPADDPRIVALNDQILGGPEHASEWKRYAGLNLFVAGEYFQYVESPEDSDEDRWILLSVTQLERSQHDNVIRFKRPAQYGGMVEYNPDDPGAGGGILERAWTPHGQLYDHADSSVRAAIVILNLIEQYDKRASAQNDSRLAGAGAMFLPDSFDFPAADDQSPVDAFEARLGTEMGKTLQDPANARSLVPIMATVNAEDIDKIKWLTFETPLDEQTKDRLDQCIIRLARSLDIPPSALLGGEGSSHWTAWKDGEDTVTQFVAPIAGRICEPLTQGWLHPIIEEMALDPAEYMVWYDLAPLLKKPDQHATAVALWDRGVINDKALRRLSGVDETDAHDADSYKIWLITQSILKAPQLIADPSFTSQLGITAEAAPAVVEAGNQPPERTEPPRTIEQESLVSGAEMAALHSLAVAGKKLLTRGVRDELMAEFQGRPFELHTRLNVTSFEHASTLLEGTWDLLPALARRTGTDVQILRDVLGFYCASKMSSAMTHDPDTLTFMLSEGILAAGHRRCSGDGCTNRLNPQPCTVPKGVTA